MDEHSIPSPHHNDVDNWTDRQLLLATYVASVKAQTTIEGFKTELTDHETRLRTLESTNTALTTESRTWGELVHRVGSLEAWRLLQAGGMTVVTFIVVLLGSLHGWFVRK